MQSFSRTLRALGLALLATLATFRPVHGQGKSDPVNFDTVDGLKIKGDYWASSLGKKAPVALLLHDFDGKKGGNRGGKEWVGLAAALNAKGYAVLTFDFRGFGESTTITNPMQFWAPPYYNKSVGVQPNPAKLQESIDHGTFRASYYPVLVNDVAAAKAFLDRKNDAGELNMSNLVVIGAGQGAAVGNLWLNGELHKKRGVPQVMGVGPVLDPRLIKFDPNYEGKDVRAAIWLTLPSSIGGITVPMKTWIIENYKTNKVPTAFIFGKDDKTADQYALSYMRTIIGSYERGKKIVDNQYPLTGEKAVEKTSLQGDKLLLKSLGIESWIVDSYLGDEEMKKTLREEWRERDFVKSKHYWLFPTANPMLPFLIPAKNENDLAPQLLPLNKFGLPN